MFIRLVSLLALVPLVTAGLNPQFLHIDAVSGRGSRGRLNVSLGNTDDFKIELAFVIFRHGDRAPGLDEMKRFPAGNLNESILHPYGEKGLTNEGKRHAFSIGNYLRNRYAGFLSDLYLPGEISIRATDHARTKMTVLTVLAVLYAPNYSIQRWNNYLNWQPVPYDTRNNTDDDLIVYKSCPKYEEIKKKVYDLPEIHKRFETYKEFLKDLSINTGYNFKGTSDVYFFNNLVHGLENIGVKLPQWIEEAKPKVTELTNFEFECEFYTPELKRLGGGVVLGDFVEASKAILSGDKSQHKVHLLSAHENSLAGFMAAAGVFTEPHQPRYGATFSLELYHSPSTNKYGVMAVYSALPGGPGQAIPIPECGGGTLCDFDTFLKLTEGIYLSRDQYNNECRAP